MLADAADVRRTSRASARSAGRRDDRLVPARPDAHRRSWSSPLPEEMPVNETVELRRTGCEQMRLAASNLVIVNALSPERFSRADAEAARRARREARPAGARRRARRAVGARRRARAARAAAAAARSEARRRRRHAARSCSSLTSASTSSSGCRGAGAPRCERRGAACDGRDVCVCAGSGGVGKTTMAAAIAMGMARRRPQRRGAHHRPGEAARQLARAAGAGQRAQRRSTRRCSRARARDARRAVRDDARHEAHLRRAGRARYAPDAASARRRSSTTASTSSSRTPSPASQEYMAMEKLYELHRDGRLRPDRARHAADAQRARLPRRARAAVALHRLALAVSSSSSRAGVGTEGLRARHRPRCSRSLKRLTGVDLLRDLSELLRRASATWPTGSASARQQVDELLADRRHDASSS